LVRDRNSGDRGDVRSALDAASGKEATAVHPSGEESLKGRDRLSRAAEVAGLGVEEFMEFSAGRQVPLHNTADDLAEDRDTAAGLKV
jgi:hypothetical protein